MKGKEFNVSEHHLERFSMQADRVKAIGQFLWQITPSELGNGNEFIHDCGQLLMEAAKEIHEAEAEINSKQ